jgi:transposase
MPDVLAPTYDELRTLVATLQATVTRLHAEVTALQEENTRLREELAKKGEPPWWAKRNTPPRAERPRKQRAHGAGRACAATPDVVVEHAAVTCPDCGHPLSGGWTYSAHEILEFPVAPVRVVRHVQVARRCGVCGRVVIPPRDPAAEGAVGRARFNARFHAVVAYWHIQGRLPLRIIQQIVRLLYQVQVSLGELRRMLDTVTAAGQPAYAALREAVRGSPVVQADETGWREDGRNGYLWAFCTPEVRYFERHATRSGQVPRDVFGEAFTGIVTCDGYKGYDALPCWKQRCWVHIVRHGHRLRAKYPEAADAHAWVDALQALYADATAQVATPGYAQRREADREALRLAYQARLLALAAPHRQAALKEWANLATYLTDYVNELFVFLQHPEVPPHNNGAEQAIRGPVTARKISGGTRTAQGSTSKMVLLSVLQTCQLRGLDPVGSLEQLLCGTPLFTSA